MSEFKFACPVCGQHITADSRASGGQITCPTCFQKLVVPQAPTQTDSKLILSAALVGKPRPVKSEPTELGLLGRPSAWRGSPSALVWVLLLLGGVVFLVTVRAMLGPASHTPPPGEDQLAAWSTYPVPTNISWTLSTTGAPIPEAPAAGRIHGAGFFHEQATLKGGTLTLWQGQSWPPDLGLSVSLFARKSADLSGKTIDVAAQRSPPLPRVLVRWRDRQRRAHTQAFKAGYSLRLEFGRAEDGKVPGKLYLCLPDESQTFVAGEFEARIISADEPPPTQRF